jgi:hypothetical protein
MWNSQLKQESYGVELLQAIGFVYVSKAKQHLATTQTFLGVGGWLHNVQGKYHVFSETYAPFSSSPRGSDGTTAFPLCDLRWSSNPCSTKYKRRSVRGI